LRRSIKLVHYTGAAFGTPQTISPSTFVDLPSPLKGFSFRDDSFPALAVVAGRPRSNPNYPGFEMDAMELAP
jgi:hypothetical protein